MKCLQKTCVQGEKGKKLSSHGCGTRYGFTLVELLSVLTILLIFMGLLFPVGEKFVEKSRRAAMASNLRQLALAYTAFASENETNANAFKFIRTLGEWASILAKTGYVNDPNFYILKNDPLFLKSAGVIPKVIGYFDSAGHWRTDADFLRTPLCWVVITNLSAHAPLSTTPFAYTRGLKIETGEWDPEKGVYGSEGGYVVFLDGHVKFYKNLSNELVKYGSGMPTSNMREAVNAGARALDWQGKIW